MTCSTPYCDKDGSRLVLGTRICEACYSYYIRHGRRLRMDARPIKMRPCDWRGCSSMARQTRGDSVYCSTHIKRVSKLHECEADGCAADTAEDSHRFCSKHMKEWKDHEAAMRSKCIRESCDEPRAEGVDRPFCVKHLKRYHRYDRVMGIWAPKRTVAA